MLATEMGKTNGGKGQYCKHLLAELLPILRAKDVEVKLIVSKDAVLPPGSEAAIVRRLPVEKNRGTLRTLAQEAWGMRHGRADVFLALGSPLPLGPTFAQREIAVIHDIHPYQHAQDPERYTGGYSRKSLAYTNLGLRNAARRADLIITDTAFVAHEIREFLGVPPERLATVPCGVDRQRFSPPGAEAVADARRRYELPDDAFVFIGDADPSPQGKKNFRLVLQAYELAQARGVSLPPTVVIGGERGQMRASRRPSDPIVRLGFVPDEDILAIMGASRALVFPSLHEGFGLPPIEAMACGLPVIASTQGSVKEVVADAGILVDPHSPTDLLAAMEAIQDASIRKALIDRGSRRARDFDWRESAQKIAAIILQGR